jgi:dolichol-phosphate mannosyltransferase
MSRRRGPKLFYKVLRRVTRVQLPADAGDFRLLSRAAVDALHQLPEHQPVYRLLVPWLGFPSGQVTYVRESRAAGKSKYPVSRILALAADSVTNFTAAPLRIATWLGMISFLVCLLLIAWVMLSAAFGVSVEGWASVLVIILFLGAVQLLCLGLLGEYVGRLYSAVQGRPAYFVAYDSADDTAAAREGQPLIAAR